MHSIVIYPVDSAIQLLNNWGQNISLPSNSPTKSRPPSTNSPLTVLPGKLAGLAGEGYSFLAAEPHEDREQVKDPGHTFLVTIFWFYDGRTGLIV